MPHLSKCGWILPVLIAVATIPARAELPANPAISARMSRFVREGQIAGAVTLVAVRGKVIHLNAVGHADIENKRLMRNDSIFAIASMTKPFSATAVMILQDKGLLSVDDPVSKYIPRFKDTHLIDGRTKGELTIRHLMTHTSGIARLPRRNTAPLTRTWELEDSADLLGRLPLQFEPGTRWQYSVGLNVCARIVEVVSKQPFDRFLDQHLFKPLKMADTTFFPDAKQRARLARTYQLTSDRKSVQRASFWMHDFSQPRTPNPSGGLFSTAGDLIRFYQMVQNGGELDGKRMVSKKAVRAMTRVQTGELPTGSRPATAGVWAGVWSASRRGLPRHCRPGHLVMAACSEPRRGSIPNES